MALETQRWDQDAFGLKKETFMNMSASECKHVSDRYDSNNSIECTFSAAGLDLQRWDVNIQL